MFTWLARDPGRRGAGHVAWRDAVWLYAYAELDKVMASEREQPSVDEFIGELPVIEWAS